MWKYFYSTSTVGVYYARYYVCVCECVRNEIINENSIIILTYRCTRLIACLHRNIYIQYT